MQLCNFSKSKKAICQKIVRILKWRRNFPISVKVDPSEKHRKFPIFSKLSDISNGDPSENRVKFSITSKFSDICAGGSVGKW